MHRNCLLGMLLYVFSVSLIGTCAPHLTAARTIPPTERDPEETRQAIPPVVLLNGKPLVYTTWEPRRYLRDGRPFLVKFKEIAGRIERFPFQWLVYPGTLAGDFADNWAVTHADAQWFYHFADLARSSSPEDLKSCADYMAEASPKEKGATRGGLAFFPRGRLASGDCHPCGRLLRSVSEFQIAGGDRGRGDWSAARAAFAILPGDDHSGARGQTQT